MSTQSTEPFSLGVVILGAGRSTRMGRPKLLLPWGERSVIGHLIGIWSSLESRQVAIVRANDDLLLTHQLDHLGFPSAARISNPFPERGMFSSILCATRWGGWKSDLTHFAIVLGDQPHLRRETLDRIVQFAKTHPDQVCQPTHAGKKRHPVVLPRDVFMQLACSSANDLKEFLSSYTALGCECNDPGLDLDIDRPEDYQKALVLAGIQAV